MNKKIDIPWPVSQIAYAFVLQHKGYSLREIGKELARSKSSVAGMFRREREKKRLRLRLEK